MASTILSGCLDCPPFSFQILELRVTDDEEAAAVRRRAQEADGAAQEELRGHEDFRSGAHRGKAGRQQDIEGKTIFN